MLLAEIGDSLTSFGQEVLGDGQDDPEEVGDVEALSGEAKDALFGDKGFNEVEVIGKRPIMIDE